MIPLPPLPKAAWLTDARIAEYARAEIRADPVGAVPVRFEDGSAFDAEITAPSGKHFVVPGFLYRLYTRRTGRITRPISVLSMKALAEGQASPTETSEDGEILQPSGSPEWRVRYAPLEPGVHRVEAVWSTPGGQTRQRMPDLTVRPARGGFVRVSRKDPRYFALDDGTPYWPIGTNLGWAGPQGLRDYEKWIPTFAQAGANWGRLWLAPGWTTLSVQAQNGDLDLAGAWRLDRVLDMAERNGMRLALCVESYNVLRDVDNWSDWFRSPWNRANGGPLAKPAEFWTDPEAARRFRAKLRYLVARYGASSSLMAWELWNEVDVVSDYAAAPVRAWHERTARELKAMDPYGHLVTTSFGGQGNAVGDRELFAGPGMDYSQTHSYEAPDLAVAVDEARRHLGDLKKPHFVGEVGADTTGPREREDLDGLQIHDPIWAALAVGDAGAAMPWWWDSYVYPQGHYKLFRPLANFVRGIAFDRERFRRTESHIAYITPPKKPERRDVAFVSTFTGWNPGLLNQPTTVRITKSGADVRTLSQLQQGVGNHGDIHNPVTFETDLPWSTRIVAAVTDVSGYGGAGLVATLDGKEMIRKDFPDPDGDRKTDTLKGFAGDYAVAVPAGRHRVTFENPGQDWFAATFRADRAVPRTAPPLRAWAQIGKTTAFAWIRQEDYAWRTVVVEKKVPPPVPPSVLVLPDLKGNWTAELWDTRTGRIVGRPKVKAGRIPLPMVKTDLAVKLRKG